jgi:histone H3/H4
MVEALTGASAAMVVKAARDAAKAAILKGRKTITESHLRDSIEDAKRHNSNGHEA